MPSEDSNSLASSWVAGAGFTAASEPGNCKGGGHPDALFTTFATQLARLPDATKLYAGAGHGFDFSADDPSAVAARRETIDFFVRHLPRNRK